MFDVNSSKSGTVRRLRTVWDESIAQEPKTAFSGELGFLKFSERVSTQFEIVDGHLFIILRTLFVAILCVLQQYRSKQ